MLRAISPGQANHLTWPKACSSDSRLGEAISVPSVLEIPRAIHSLQFAFRQMR
jgi:hypothetical protein